MRIFTILVILLTPVLLSSYTGEKTDSMRTPGQFTEGLAFDGNFLINADRQTDLIYFIDPATGETKKELESPAYWTTGLTWDGSALWAADVKGGLPLSENYKGKIYKIDPESGVILHTVNAPCKRPRGLAFDGKYLWVTDNASNKIIQFDQNDGTTIKDFDAPAKDPRGITFDGKYLWVGDRKRDEIYMMDPETGYVLLTADAPGKFVKGLCFDGKSLWAADDQVNKTYKLKIRDGVKFRRTDPRKAKVRYIHQTTNYGPGTLKELNVHIAIPENRDNQKITWEPSFIPNTYKLKTDKWDQKTAEYTVKDISPGKRFEAEMNTEATVYDLRYFIYPDEVGTLNDIPQNIKDRYLVNNDKYRFDHPIIQKAVKKAVGGETNPYKIMRLIFSYLIDNMYYEMVGGWNTAPAVLKRGNGSCSEYSFVYIAMCRAAGLPARYVGAVVVRGDEASMDDVFHRWAEIYLPNYGWIPVDPSGGDKARPADRADYIGHLSNRFLITTQSGGGSKTMEWTYNSNESWTSEPKAFIVVDKFADWEPVEK